MTFERNLLYIVPSAVINLGGTASNIFSLYFFIHTNNGSLGTRLLMLLNTLDLCVCLTALFSFAGQYFHEINQCWDYLSASLNVLYGVFLECTGFVTCLLSLCRTICMCFPFYNINKRAVAISTVVFVLTTVLREGGARVSYYVLIAANSTDILYFYMDASSSLAVANLSLMIVIVAVSTVVSVVKLTVTSEKYNERSAENIKKATVTVVILSILFCIFNIFYIIITGYMISVSFADGKNATVYYLALWFAIPLNSACNPFVYLSRKPDMRAFAMKTMRRKATALQRISRSNAVEMSEIATLAIVPSPAQNKPKSAA